MVISRRRTATIVAAALAVSLSPGPAAADFVSRQDPKDPNGRLDIRRVSHGHAGDDAVTHTIGTYRRFTSRLLRPHRRPGGTFVLLMAAPGLADGRIVFLRWRKGSLRAPMFDLMTEEFVGMARVTRPNPRAVRITLTKTQLGVLGDPPGYFWVGLSFYTNRARCREDGCFDVAPNRGLIRHRLPAEPPPEELSTSPQQIDGGDLVSILNERESLKARLGVSSLRGLLTG
jgi:hypothetical protein